MEQMHQYMSGFCAVLNLVYWLLLLQHCSPYSDFTYRANFGSFQGKLREGRGWRGEGFVRNIYTSRHTHYTTLKQQTEKKKLPSVKKNFFYGVCEPRNLKVSKVCYDNPSFTRPLPPCKSYHDS